MQLSKEGFASIGLALNTFFNSETSVINFSVLVSMSSSFGGEISLFLSLYIKVSFVAFLEEGLCISSNFQINEYNNICSSSLSFSTPVLKSYISTSFSLILKKSTYPKKFNLLDEISNSDKRISL